jgi:ribosomal protein L12E/L44/L45/RPP1/RPP2
MDTVNVTSVQGAAAVPSSPSSLSDTEEIDETGNDEEESGEESTNDGGSNDDSTDDGSNGLFG